MCLMCSLYNFFLICGFFFICGLYCTENKCDESSIKKELHVENMRENIKVIIDSALR